MPTLNKGIIFLFALLLPAPGIAQAASPAGSANNDGSHPEYDIFVSRVIPRSPATRGGLKTGDVILKINGEAVTTLSGVKQSLKQVPSQGKAVLYISRDGHKEELVITANKGDRFRFGFLIKRRDKDIIKQVKFKIWPEKLNPSFMRFKIPFQSRFMREMSNQSPEKTVLFHMKELLLSKGYVYTEGFSNADFIVKAEFRQPKVIDLSTKTKKALPFDALRIIFFENNSKKSFLNVSGTLDSKKVKFYGAKNYVFSMLDVMFENFPRYVNGTGALKN